MRDYGKIHIAFWSSPDVSSFSDDAKLLAVYLLSSPHSTLIGCYRLPDGYVSEDLKWPSERVAKGLAELFEKGFAYRCETTKWVWIYRYLKWNRPENPNQWKAVRKAREQIPAGCLWEPYFSMLLLLLDGDIDGEDEDPFDTVVKRFRNQKQEQKQEQEQKQKQKQETFLRPTEPEAATACPPSADKEQGKPAKKPQCTPEDIEAAKWMFERIKVVAPSAKEPNLESWGKEFRLMREQDGRTHRQILELFRWANADSFWRANILSPSKLREKWTELDAKRLSSGAGGLAPVNRQAALEQRNNAAAQEWLRQEGVVAND